MDNDTLVVAGAILLAPWSEFVRHQIAQLLKRLKVVRFWVLTIEFGPEAPTATGPEKPK